MKYLGIALLRGYQLLISPLVPGSCKYHPSCSEYAVQALRRYGLVKGSILAGWRLLRCNPWSRGGVDHVHDQHLFGRVSGRVEGVGGKQGFPHATEPKARVP